MLQYIIFTKGTEKIITKLVLSEPWMDLVEVNRTNVVRLARQGAMCKIFN